MTNKKRLTLIAAFSMGLLPLAYAQQAVEKAASPREQLQQYVTELQKNPNDHALREKIIKLTLTLDPKPAIPKETNRPFVMAVTFQKEAKDASGYELAIKAYREALLLAPWWPEANWNLSVAQEAAGRYDDAMSTLKLYILTKLEDASQAETRLHSLEAKKTMAERETASPQALAAKQREKDEQLIKSLNGAVFAERTVGDSEFRFHREIQIVGNKAEFYNVIEYLSRQRQRDNSHLYVGKHHVWGYEGWFALTGREFVDKYRNKYAVSDDGAFISQRKPDGTEIDRFQRRK